MATESPLRTLRARIRAIRAELGKVDLICSGTLLERMKTCGKPTCRCATDPDARHGPYFEWTHLRDGKYLHRVVPPAKAEALRGAIANYQAIQQLLKQWEAESEQFIDAQFPRKP
jgi:hypothetical protein